MPLAKYVHFFVDLSQNMQQKLKSNKAKAVRKKRVMI